MSVLFDIQTRLNVKILSMDKEKDEEGDGEGNEEGVDAVEESTVTRNPVAGILKTVVALQFRFNKVADCAENTCGGSKQHPYAEAICFHPKECRAVTLEEVSAYQSDRNPSKETFPSLVGRNRGT